jgi:hypothetical protein
MTQQMIKEFTPLSGYISWSSFQWIICIIFSKCSKMCFTMLKIPNRLLQWLQNIQKPIARLFRHLVWPKIEEDRLPGSPPSNLLSLHLQNVPLFAQPSPHAYLSIKTQHRVQPHDRYKLSNGYALALNRPRPTGTSPPYDLAHI